jgi:hypothetical protein
MGFRRQIAEKESREVQHYYIDRFLNGQLTATILVHGKEELTDMMNDLIQDAGKELSVPVTEYHMFQSVSVKNVKHENVILLAVDPGYTEAQMIEAGLIENPEILLDRDVWGAVFDFDYRSE